MFGINDDDSKNNDNNQTPGNNPAQTPPNPFGDSSDSPAATNTTANTATAPEISMAEPPSTDSQPSDSPADGDLLDIKQKALQNLQPLVSHLEQSPEEKFKTTMMLIQATDNSALVNQAYDAAKEIPDEKARAQALLDVVNEINYFTHQKTDSDEPKP